jgi:hypothetical protein
MDDSAALIIERPVDSAAAAKTECIALNPPGSVDETLRSLNVFRRLPKGRFVDDLDAARELAGELLGDRARQQGISPNRAPTAVQVC